MRLAAILIILAILATMVSGAQCVVACVHPASPPPCHHSPEKAAKTCDASSIFGEKPAVTVIESPFAGPAASLWNPEPSAPPHTIVTAAAGLTLHPPGEAAPRVLRI